MTAALAALLLEPLAELGRAGAGRSAPPPSCFSPAVAPLRLRLAALNKLGRAGSACLNRALAALARGGALRAREVAVGLEALLRGMSGELWRGRWGSAPAQLH